VQGPRLVVAAGPVLQQPEPVVHQPRRGPRRQRLAVQGQRLVVVLGRERGLGPLEQVADCDRHGGRGGDDDTRVRLGRGGGLGPALQGVEVAPGLGVVRVEGQQGAAQHKSFSGRALRLAAVFTQGTL
jgi:hypothetical protein